MSRYATLGLHVECATYGLHVASDGIECEEQGIELARSDFELGGLGDDPAASLGALWIDGADRDGNWANAEVKDETFAAPDVVVATSDGGAYGGDVGACDDFTKGAVEGALAQRNLAVSDAELAPGEAKKKQCKEGKRDHRKRGRAKEGSDEPDDAIELGGRGEPDQQHGRKHQTHAASAHRADAQNETEPGVERTSS